MYAKVHGFNTATTERATDPPIATREFTGPLSYVLSAIMEWKQGNPSIKAIEFEELES